MSEREGAQRERGATTLGRPEGRGPGQREERAQSEREGAQRERPEGRGPGQREERAQSEREGAQREERAHSEHAAPGEPSSVGEEAARLAEAVRGWARATFPGLTDHLATGAPECRYCPFCQLVAVLRGDRPEVTERVAEAASAVAEAVRVVADALARPATGARSAAAAGAGRGDAAPAGPGGPHGPTARRVEPVDVV